jgi:hypothetical protein
VKKQGYLQDRHRYHLGEMKAIAVTLGGFNPDVKGVQRPRMRGLTSGYGDKDEDLILIRSEMGLALNPQFQSVLWLKTPTLKSG